MKFNVIIPTRERADTLYHCLRTVVAQQYENLNIIVSDNYSQDRTREVVTSFSDSRIKYLNTGKRISMSHNWEFALNHVTDGWVTFLGDDDGLLPGGLAKVNRVINETGCQAVTSAWCYYFWPGVTNSQNQLSIPVTAGIELRDAKKWLFKVMRGDALYRDLPWLYTGGFAESALINSAKNRCGNFYLSRVPDIYSAVALASITDTYVFMKDPVSVAGISSHSTGASSLEQGTNQISLQKYFSEENMPFHSSLGSGRTKSIPLLVYECYLQSMHLHHDFLKVNMADQLALALSHSSIWKPEHYDEIREYCNDVARLNDISIKNVEKKSKFIKFRMWRLYLYYIRKQFQEITINAQEFNIKDIHGAAFLSNALYVFNKQLKYWCWRNLIRFMLKILKIKSKKLEAS
ncbi:glycosyltransferase family 2 protein [Thermodesulfobacteriota bacterium]